MRNVLMRKYKKYVTTCKMLSLLSTLIKLQTGTLLFWHTVNKIHNTKVKKDCFCYNYLLPITLFLYKHFTPENWGAYKHN